MTDTDDVQGVRCTREGNGTEETADDLHRPALQTTLCPLESPILPPMIPPANPKANSTRVEGLCRRRSINRLNLHRDSEDQEGSLH